MVGIHRLNVRTLDNCSQERVWGGGGGCSKVGTWGGMGGHTYRANMGGIYL